MSKKQNAGQIETLEPAVDLSETQAEIQQPDFVVEQLDLAEQAAETPTAAPAEARGRKATYADSDLIEVVVAANPKKPSGASYHRFNLGATGMTVGAYIKACVAAGTDEAKKATRLAHTDLRWNVDHKFWAVHPAGTVIGEPEADA